MRTETITRTYYRYDELSEEAKERALEAYRERLDRQDDDYAAREICDSLKAVFKAANIPLRGWAIGAYSYSYVKLDMDDAVKELKGKRAIAWLENNLLSSLRTTWKQSIPCCPFTGVCYDEDFLESLRTDLRDPRNTLGDAFSSLADVARDLIEQNYEYRRTEDSILEDFEANDQEFTEDGELA